MPADDLALLRSAPQRPVMIQFVDGESVIATELTLLEDEGLIWYRLLRSNRQQKYESFDEPHLYSARLSDIMACDLAGEES